MLPIKPLAAAFRTSKIILFAGSVYFWNTEVIGQTDANIDSLLRIAQNNPTDTSGTRAYCDLCFALRKTDTVKAREYGQKGYQMAMDQNFLLGQAACLSNLGSVYYHRGDYSTAIRYFKSSYEARSKTSQKWAAAVTLSDIGNAYGDANDYQNALAWLLKSREAFRELNDSVNQVYTLTAIGGIYYMNDDPGSAAGVLREALELSFALKDSFFIGTALTNVGLMEGELGHYDTAMTYMLRAIKFDLSRNDTTSLAADYLNLGVMYYRVKDYPNALDYYQKALYLYEQLNDNVSLAICLNNIGEVWLDKGDRNKAIEYCTRSYEIGEMTASLELIKESAKLLARAYGEKGNYADAFRFQKIYSDTRDSLFNAEKQAAISEMQTKYDVANTERKNEMLASQLELESLESEQRRILNYGIGCIALLVMAAAFVSYRAYRQKLTANSLLEAKNAEINEQKIIVEEKNKNITDSINYAQKIQKAILPDPNYFRALFPESFILFRPKDIVSGDFYWMYETPEFTFYATADCTGHGVPGGFMSVLGASLLNEIVSEKKISEPADVLDMMRLKIIISLKQKGALGENKDGMDMVLCRINKERTELVFVAANNPLWMVRDGAFIEYKPDKQAVGINIGDSAQFTQHRIPLQKGDMIYTLTDGYPDQFGGEKGKKYKYKALQEKILSLSNLEMKYQHYALEKEFDRWKGNIEQIDDVLMMGVKIS